jgi:hypothetical protein
MATSVIRESVRHFPSSNTEINFERLPSKSDLEGMELCYRGHSSINSLSKLLVGLILPLMFAQVCALWFPVLPQTLEWLWREAHLVDGMPVVGGMLTGIALLIALLCLVFVPHALRIALLTMTSPLILATAAEWKGKTWHPYLLVGLVGFVVCMFWKSSFIAFYESWLSADPRMTTAQSTAWKESIKGGWGRPGMADACQVISRYLTHDSSSGVPGVWNAPSSRTKRVAISGLLVGSIFALATGFVSIVSVVGFASVVSVGASAVMLFTLTIWVMGHACGLSDDYQDHLQIDSRMPFERFADRLRNSGHVSSDVITGAPVREADHLFIGMEPWQQFPILLHEPMLREHVYVSGQTGSGKTSMAFMLLLIQLIRGRRLSAARWSEKSPLIIVDLKGDKAMFHTAQAEAQARGQKFRFFTLEPGKASFHFNPFLAFKSGSVTLPQLVQSLLDALGLYYGDEYGKRYYSERHRNLLTEAIQSSANIDNFRTLYARIKVLYENNQKEFSDGFELVSVVSGLTHYDQLISDVGQEQAGDTIRFDRVLENREVVYFWLPTVKESIAAKQIAKFVLFCLRAAAGDRENAGHELRQCYLMVDEFQKVAGDNLQGIIQQARSAGIAAILANQSISDLKTPSWDLTPTIRTVRTKLMFSLTEPEEIKAWRELAGEELQTFGMNETEEIRGRLSVKDLASLTDHPKRFLLHVTSGSGYTQFGGLPIPVETDWPISKQLSDERAMMPWPSMPRVIKPASQPAPQPGKIKAKRVPKGPTPLAAPTPTPTAAVHTAFAQKIGTLMEE